MKISTTRPKKIIYGLLAGLLSGGLASCSSSRVDAAATTPSRSALASPPAQSVVPTSYQAVSERPASPTPPAAAIARALPRRPPGAPPSLLSGALPAPALSPLPAKVAPPPAAVGPATRVQAGRIIGESGQPLVGATVLLKGTNQGASTDANGNYSLEVPTGNNTFIFGYGGYEDEVAQIRDGLPLTVTLLPAADREKPRKKR